MTSFGSHDIIVRIVCREGRQEFRAWLGELRNGMVTILLRYEYHGTHPGWHVHAVCGDIDADDVRSGVASAPWIRRIPAGNAYHREHEKDFLRTDHVLTQVVSAFRLKKEPGELLLR